MTDAETYSIKLERAEGIHPEDIPAWQLAELIAVLAKQFADKTNDFCLTSMEDNCVRLNFRIISSAVKATVAGFAAFLAGQVVDPDSPFLQHLSEFDKVRSKFEGVFFTFPSVSGFAAVTIPPEKKLAEMVKKKPNIHFSHTVYGKVMDVGGEKPNIHIRPLGGETDIICDCSEELAMEVSPLLYSVVGIAGEVIKSDPPMRMRGIRLLPYRKPTRNPFEILKEAGMGKYFEGESVEDFMRRVRGANEEDNG